MNENSKDLYNGEIDKIEMYSCASQEDNSRSDKKHHHNNKHHNGKKHDENDSDWDDHDENDSDWDDHDENDSDWDDHDENDSDWDDHDVNGNGPKGNDPKGNGHDGNNGKCHDNHHDGDEIQEECCKLALKKALELLGCEESGLINFQAAAFITDYYIVGSNLVLFEPNKDIKNFDNLGSKLTGALSELPKCNCDVLDIEGKPVYPIPLPTDPISFLYGLKDFTEDLICGGLKAVLDLILPNAKSALSAKNGEGTDEITPIDLIIKLYDVIADAIVKIFTPLEKVDTASLCQIRAMAFDLKCDEAYQKKSNYDRLKNEIKDLVEQKCPEKVECKQGCEDCSCEKGVLSKVVGSILKKKVSLTVGSLTLENVDVLGNIDGAIILGAPPRKAQDIDLQIIEDLLGQEELTLPIPATPGRIYVVCADAVTFIDK